MEIFGAAGNRTNTLAGQTDVIAGFVAASDLNAPLIVALSFGFRFVLNCVMTFSKYCWRVGVNHTSN